MIIAIDGPAGSGKSTVAKLVDLSNIDESKIRTPEVSRAVSLVAKISEVRVLAIEIDTTGLGISEVVEQICALK